MFQPCQDVSTVWPHEPFALETASASCKRHEGCMPSLGSFVQAQEKVRAESVAACQKMCVESVQDLVVVHLVGWSKTTFTASCPAVHTSQGGLRSLQFLRQLPPVFFARPPIHEKT